LWNTKIYNIIVLLYADQVTVHRNGMSSRTEEMHPTNLVGI